MKVIPPKKSIVTMVCDPGLPTRERTGADVFVIRYGKVGV